MRQQFIMKSLKHALVNSPPTRLQQMTFEAMNGFTTKELERLSEKLEVIQLFIKNNLQVRVNQHNNLLNSNLDKKDKMQLIKALHKGYMNGSLK